MGNALEGEQFVIAMANLPTNLRMPIISHWGITGGEFFNNVKQFLQKDVDLSFIQSCFSLRDAQSELAIQVINDAKKLFPEQFKDAVTLPAPDGFIHAYDLANVFLNALANIPLNHDIKTTRSLLHQQLENLQKPVKGLFKTYQQPFTVWSSDSPDAHEALGLDDFRMAKYMPDGGYAEKKSIETIFDGF